MTPTEQAEQIISDTMAGPYGAQSRYAAARRGLAAVAYNIALDVSRGEQPTEGQLARFAAFDAIVKREELA